MNDPVTDEAIRACLETLRAVGRLEPSDPRYVEVERAVSGLAKTAKRKRRHARRVEARAHDRRAVDATELAREQLARAGLPARDEPASVVLRNQRLCAVCKQPYRELDARYPHHCPSCSALDETRRHRRGDLRGRRALVTGGRIKIGFELALKLLRDGAHVAITTRFPADARARFEALPDADELVERLEVHALHLGDLPEVLRWIEERRRAWPHLDILVNNAAQTVRRPPAYYASWARLEREHALVVPSQSALVRFHDACIETRDAALFPLGLLDEEGLPLDRRRTNSWKLEADDVSPVELAEVMVINAIVPFLLTTRLLPSFERSPHGDRYVVHASAVEGQFETRAKMPRHPHTNMAKAALNMFTRTSAKRFAERGLYMTSVDTGWVTNENPEHERTRQRARGFRAPLDVVDGAARLYDPILRGLAGDRVHGVLLKDYFPVAW